ncbi:hypothetical protein RD110_12845 [Rhodoferax koreense]|uniref:Uncharacterized protein n=1 Tax=Rhodoferax koreensis TaxID=1842727 RepID=A0A1P8JW34_9BURK|nr:hypothetical protein [Rhodoferax koreense]APW37970.1 hypothetical protein RD110_12845 [Rhodoferax koreense]
MISFPTLARWLVALSVASAAVAATTAHAADDTAANALRAKYDSLAPTLRNNIFKRALHLESTESSSELKGDIYAVVNHPFATVESSLKDPDVWCDVLILHLNTKLCRAEGEAANPALVLYVGRKYDQPLEDAYKLRFSYRLAANAPEYFEVLLNAPAGPVGTRDYRIVLEAIPLAPQDGKAERTLVHLTYAYAYGLPARLAMQTYLATVAREKVGFTVTGKDADGKPEYVGGVRGVVERNTMRYYLAIDAYLGSLRLPPGEQFDRRLKTWFDASEQYALQLHEMELADYMTMKHAENERQHKAP